MERYPLKEIKELQNEITRNSFVSKDFKKIMNYSQGFILRVVLESENIEERVYQKDLEKILNIRKSTLSGILDTMEKNKIIKRVPDLVTRGNIIELSDEMKKCKEELLERIKKVEENLTNGISEEDLDAFFRVIDRMKKNIGKEEN